MMQANSVINGVFHGGKGATGCCGYCWAAKETSLTDAYLLEQYSSVYTMRHTYCCLRLALAVDNWLL